MVKPSFLFLHILDVLDSGEETTLKQISNELGVSRTTLKLTLEELVEQGFAEEKVRGRRRYWTITDKGRSLGAFHQIEALAEHVGRIVGDEEVTRKVMEGSEKITAISTESEVAGWYKGAMERLDTLVDERTRALVMEYCGYNCALGNRDHIEAAIAERMKYKSLDEYLQAEQSWLVREGDVIYQTYRPQSM